MNAPRKKSRKPNSTDLIALRSKAKREGWLKYIRQGEGEEADERAMLNGCVFDVRRAEHWLNFADQFGTLTEGVWRGQPFRLLPWQVTCSSQFFGWVRYSEEWGFDVRRFRMWYLELPKKNGKTPFLSLLGNYLLFADAINADGNARQIALYLAATTRKQAQKCLMHAIRQIRNSDALSEVSKIIKQEGFYTVEYGDSTWEVLAADAASADGVNGHCLADEFHRWKGFEFYNALKWMLASQPEGAFIAVTTSGEEGENVCKYTHDHAVSVNKGITYDDTILGTIFGLTKDDDPHDESNWFKANPSLGTDKDSPLKLTTFRNDYLAAKDDPSGWIEFKRLRLGIWATSLNSWLDTSLPRGVSDWDSGRADRKEAKARIDCYAKFEDKDLLEIDAVSCSLGLDLASVRDTVAAVLCVEDVDGVLWIRPWFWLPELEAKRQAKRVNYIRWAENGHIKLTPGRSIDYPILTQDLVDIIKTYHVNEFYYDPHQAENITQELEAMTQAERVEFPQQIIHYGPVVQDLERRIIAQRIRHNGSPVMTWQMANALALTNTNGFKRLVKQSKGDFKKVDGPQALLMSMQTVVSRGIEIEDDVDDDVFTLD